MNRMIDFDDPTAEKKKRNSIQTGRIFLAIHTEN